MFNAKFIKRQEETNLTYFEMKIRYLAVPQRMSQRNRTGFQT